jgi:hypothetical protein
MQCAQTMICATPFSMSEWRGNRKGFTRIQKNGAIPKSQFMPILDFRSWILDPVDQAEAGTGDNYKQIRDL